jgi:hypothetical protein
MSKKLYFGTNFCVFWHFTVRVADCNPVGLNEGWWIWVTTFFYLTWLNKKWLQPIWVAVRGVTTHLGCSQRGYNPFYTVSVSTPGSTSGWIRFFFFLFFIKNIHIFDKSEFFNYKNLTKSRLLKLQKKFGFRKWLQYSYMNILLFCSLKSL